MVGKVMESFASLCEGNMPCGNITYRAGGSVGRSVMAGGGCESSEGVRDNGGLMQLSRGGAQTQHSIVCAHVLRNMHRGLWCGLCTWWISSAAEMEVLYTLWSGWRVFVRKWVVMGGDAGYCSSPALIGGHHGSFCGNRAQ